MVTESISLTISNLVDESTLQLFFINPLNQFLERHRLGKIYWIEGRFSDEPITGMIGVLISRISEDDSACDILFCLDGKAEIVYGTKFDEHYPNLELPHGRTLNWQEVCRWLLNLFQQEAAVRVIPQSVFQKLALAGDALK